MRSWAGLSLFSRVQWEQWHLGLLIWLKHKLRIWLLVDQPEATLFFLLPSPSFFSGNQFQCADVIGWLKGWNKTTCAMILVQTLAHRSQWVVSKMILISLSPGSVPGPWDQAANSREGPQPLGQSVSKHRFHGDSTQTVAQQEGRLARGPQARQECCRAQQRALRLVAINSEAACTNLLKCCKELAHQPGRKCNLSGQRRGLDFWWHSLVIVLLGQSKVRSWRPSALFLLVPFQLLWNEKQTGNLHSRMFFWSWVPYKVSEVGLRQSWLWAPYHLLSTCTRSYFVPDSLQRLR